MSEPQNPYESPQSSDAETPSSADWPIVIETGLSRREEELARRIRPAYRPIEILLMFVLAGVLAPVWIVFPRSDPRAFWVSVLILVLAGIVFKFLSWGQVVPVYRRGVMPHLTEISPRGIVTTTPTLRTEQPWDVFIRYGLIGRLLLLYYDEGRSFCVFGRSQFANDVQWQQFIALVASQFKAPEHTTGSRRPRIPLLNLIAAVLLFATAAAGAMYLIAMVVAIIWGVISVHMEL